MKQTLSLTLALLILAFMPDILPAQNLEAQFDALLTKTFNADGSGGAVLVVKNGQTLYRKAIGKANLELDVDMRPDHVFRIGSITKQFTACAILKLEEEGKLSVKDPITKYVKDYPTHGHTITIEHLLTHTSGIKSYTSLEKWDDEARKSDFTPEALIDYFKNEPMDFAPGEKFLYNNSGYVLLGYIIEQVSGKSYGDYIEQTFFRPLGMNNSYYGHTAPIIKNRAAGYHKDGDAYGNADFLSMTQPYAAGSLLSTVDDLNTWYQAVVEGNVISKASLAKALTSYKLNNGKETGYGYGWSLGNIQGSPMFSHGGGINGFTTASLYLTDEKVFATVFSNCTCINPGDVANRMAAVAIGKPFDYKKIDLSAGELAAYPAVYESDHEGQRIITVDQGRIYSQRTGGPKFEIFPYAKDKFYFENSTSTLEFQRNKKGAIVSVSLHSAALPATWMRTDKEIPKMTAVEVPARLLEMYVGKYQLAPEFIIAITLEGEQLYAQATGQGKIEIFPYEQHKFFTKGIDAKFHFETDAANKVTGMVLVQNGEHPGKKVD